MYHYAFYMRKLNQELSERSQEFVLENNGYFEMKKFDCLYEMNYELKGNKEKCDENMAHVISDIIQKQAIIKVCDAFFKAKEGLSPLEQKEIGEAFLNNNYLSRQEGFSYITYYLLYLPVFKEIKEKRGFKKKQSYGNIIYLHVCRLYLYSSRP